MEELKEMLESYKKSVTKLVGLLQAQIDKLTIRNSELEKENAELRRELSKKTISWW